MPPACPDLTFHDDTGDESGDLMMKWKLQFKCANFGRLSNPDSFDLIDCVELLTQSVIANNIYLSTINLSNKNYNIFKNKLTRSNKLCVFFQTRLVSTYMSTRVFGQLST